MLQDHDTPNDENIDYGESVYEDFDYNDLRSLKRLKKSDKKQKEFIFTAKLGEEVKNGIRYWGKQRVVNYIHRATFICPECGNTWEASIKRILEGKTLNCGCVKNR